MSPDTSKKVSSAQPRAEATTPSKACLALRLLRGERTGARFLLNGGGDYLVGRTQGALNFPTDRALSDPHALFMAGQGWLAMRVFPTRAGVYRRLRGEARIEAGTLFSVGNHHLRFLGKLPEAVDTDAGNGPPPGRRPLYGVEELLRGAIAGRRVVRPAPRLIIGNGGCDLDFQDDPLVQARHCELSFEPKGTFLRDLGSADGTFLRVPDDEELLLEPGDCLRIGDQFLQVEED